MKPRGVRPMVVVVAVCLVVRAIRRWSLAEEEWIEGLRRRAGEEERARRELAGAADSSGKTNVTVKRAKFKRKYLRRKINFRRKDFGSLDEWDPDPQMKKVLQPGLGRDTVTAPQVLLWTGYGPQQEGNQLWARVFSALASSPSSCPEARSATMSSNSRAPPRISL
jgi:hypothetical protein